MDCLCTDLLEALLPSLGIFAYILINFGTAVFDFMHVFPLPTGSTWPSGGRGRLTAKAWLVGEGRRGLSENPPK